MDPQDGGLRQGERLWLWLWLALLLTSASVAVTGSNCACQGPVQGSCGYHKDDSRDNLYNTRNVALGKPTKASSLFNSERFNEVSGPACLAVNGDRSIKFTPCNQFPNNSSCIHTADDDREPYWEVDLCDLYNITSITVYWRDSKSQRNVGVNVTVDGKLCYIFTNPVSNPSTITCYQRLSGKTVRLSKTDYTTRNNYFLTLCEVEVTVLNCTCQGPVHGSCDHRRDDFRANLFNTQNVALGKPTKVSSLLNSTRMKVVSGPACLAVNGDRSTTFTSCNMSPNSPSCIHTAEGDREPYWEVDLCDLYSIASITVYWRDSESQRNVGVNVTVDGKLCYIFTNPVSNPSTITCYQRLSGKTVRLSKTDYTTRNDYFLTLCEVEVTVLNCTCQGPVHGSCYHRRDDFRANLSNTQNVALCKPAKVSSLLNNEIYNEVSGPACLAVNGDRSIKFTPCNQFPDNANCIHTADDDREPYWEVDLCDLYNITSITVYWRDSKSQRNVGVNVTVDGQLCYIFTNPVSNPSTITCYQRLSGKTVRLSKTDYTTIDDYFLTLCEVEVMVLNCTCQGPVHGSCDHRRDDFRANLFNTQNVALGKPAKVSSLLNNEIYNEVSGPACLAVNGDRSTTFRPCNQFPNNSNCIHTAEGDREPYWEVDLCDLYNITSITVYWRDSQSPRNVGVNVTVDGKLCYTFEHPVSNPSTITCYQRLSGKTVRLSKFDYRTTNDYYLTLCEVEVMGDGKSTSVVLVCRDKGTDAIETYEESILQWRKYKSFLKKNTQLLMSVLPPDASELSDEDEGDDNFASAGDIEWSHDYGATSYFYF